MGVLEYDNIITQEKEFVYGIVRGGIAGGERGHTGGERQVRHMQGNSQDLYKGGVSKAKACGGQNKKQQEGAQNKKQGSGAQNKANPERSY